MATTLPLLTNSLYGAGAGYFASFPSSITVTVTGAPSGGVFLDLSTDGSWSDVPSLVTLYAAGAFTVPIPANVKAIRAVYAPPDPHSPNGTTVPLALPILTNSILDAPAPVTVSASW